MLKKIINFFRIKYYNLKLKHCFKKNEDSGKLIPVNDKSRGLGKTTLLIAQALKKNVLIIVKYESNKQYIEDQIYKYLSNKMKWDQSDSWAKHISHSFTYNLQDIENGRHLGLKIKSFYVDEGLSLEDISKLRNQYNLTIKNGFYYNENITSPIEIK